MKNESNEIEELREEVRLLQEILELKQKVAKLENRQRLIPCTPVYPYVPCPNCKPAFPDTWSDSATYSPRDGEVIVIN